MKKLFYLIFVFAILVNSVHSLMPVDTSDLLVNSQKKDVYSIESYQKMMNIEKNSNNNLNIVWDNVHAVPSSVVGKIDKNWDFLENMANELPAGISLNKAVDKGFNSIYQYNYGMYEIFPGTLTYKIDNERFMAAGSFIFNSEILNQDNISEKEASHIAFDYSGSDNDGVIVDTEKVLFNTLDGLKWAYNVKIVSVNPIGEFLITVDSSDGKILYCDDFVQYYSGKASVYPTNPLKSSITVKPVDNINYSGSLSGYYTKVLNEDVKEAYSDNNNFVYPYEDTHFAEANVYYHIDFIHSFYKKTFDYVELDKVMKATVHYGDKYDNAFFSPWGQYFCFGDGNKLNDLAVEASVIYHEYTHAVSYEMAGLGNYGEAGGMNEALSDYFGNSLTNDPAIGEWVMAKLNRPYMRSCKNDTHYPEDYEGECHHDSLMFSAPLWEMRERFGKTVADELAHRMREYINYQSKFSDGLAAILQVDEVRFGGVHKDDILKIFAERGITLNDNNFRNRLIEKIAVKNLY